MYNLPLNAGVGYTTSCAVAIPASNTMADREHNIFFIISALVDD
jgi:hypothetical protein